MICLIVSIPKPDCQAASGGPVILHPIQTNRL